MKRTFTPLLLCACTGLIAQPNFPSSYFNSTIGSISTIRMADYLEPGPATNGFVFDASDATLGDATASQYVDPASTPYASDFPYANLATLTLSQTGYGYAQITANSMLSWGLESTSQSVIYSNAEKVYPIPLDFGATWTDGWAASIEAGGFTISRTGQTTGAYASYGSVVLPFGTFSNVARVELDQTYSDTYQSMPYASYTCSIVSYVSPDYPVALFSSTTLTVTFDGIPDPQVVQYSTMIDASMVGVTEHVGRSPLATAYPNPAHGNGRVRFADAQAGPVELVLLDMLGRPVRTRSAVVTMPGQELNVDLEGLTVGLYSLRITTADGRVSTIPWMVE